MKARAPEARTIESVGMALDRTAALLRRARLAYGTGTVDAAQEATWMIAHVLGVPFEGVGGCLPDPLPARAARRLAGIVERRIGERVPLPYLLGEAWLAGYRFRVDARAIIPRSFIAELLVMRMRPWIRSPDRVRAVLDLCTGSACLAIIAADVFARADVIGAELSPRALQLARRNVRDHGLEERVALVRSDLYAATGDGPFDLIIANPPYVNAAAMSRLPAEFRHEPALALAGGPDGLDLVERILQGAAGRLAPRGVLVIEIGHNARAFERRFRRMAFDWAATSGGERMVAVVPASALPTPA